ncbi:MAG: preprotein translocase subunit SecA [Bacilli bacterium]|nr:preprotein translocase subunit SecA [Bacilli bacterium]
MFSIFKKMFSTDAKQYQKVEKLAIQVDQLKEEMEALSDDLLKEKTIEFKKRYQNGETLDDLLVEAFAVSREACYRAIGLYPFFVQIVGAAVLHFGDIAEMKTGEGKTLTSVMTAYLNALSGEGVHIVTVNEYLAKRDSEEMGVIFKWLGLEVGLNRANMSAGLKREAYAADITYTTNSELGFDYLRDNMVQSLDQRVLRGLNYAIVDECDSILIDESRTPLIISGGNMQSRKLYISANTFAKTLKEEDYLIDKKTKGIFLSASGILKAEKMFKIKNIYQLEHNALVHHINNALKANFTMANDVEYLIRNGEVMLIDPFTGRVMEGRQYSDGLHQAIEAKEGVKINEETRTMATITYQNFFRLYKKLSGMTGTAKTEEEEFSTTYNMYVIEVPTNEPVIRIDNPDQIFVDKKSKFEALAKEVKDHYDTGRPVLIGTVAVETSEEISKYLKKYKINHEILNAKNHEREAEIIAKAGQYQAVTLATNMAGRGTDIKLSDETRALGGLAVIGSERHESRRIDNQLRGRSGRQGDPGSSVFYLSFEDELLQRFGKNSWMIQKIGEVQGEEALSSGMLAKAIESAQKTGEGYNFDSRKHLLEYDNINSTQRNQMYSERDKVLNAESMKETILSTIEDTINIHVNNFINDDGELAVNDLIESLEGRMIKTGSIKASEIENKSINEVQAHFHNICLNDYLAVRQKDSANVKELEKLILISVIDHYWMLHIDTMTKLRDAVQLRSYAQKQPIQEYREEGNKLFEEIFPAIMRDVAYSVMNLAYREN